jgi:hypothetical protein
MLNMDMKKIVNTLVMLFTVSVAHGATLISTFTGNYITSSVFLDAGVYTYQYQINENLTNLGSIELFMPHPNEIFNVAATGYYDLTITTNSIKFDNLENIVPFNILFNSNGGSMMGVANIMIFDQSMFDAVLIPSCDAVPEPNYPALFMATFAILGLRRRRC